MKPRKQMSKERLYIFDTTLRCSNQGVDFSIEEEKIASALDNLGVDYIEGGWPGANPTDTEFFKKHSFNNSKLTCFGMTKGQVEVKMIQDYQH